MAFNAGGFNRLPFNRSPSMPIEFEIDFNTSLDLDVDGIEIDDSLMVDFGISLDAEAELIKIVFLECNFDTSLEVEAQLVQVSSLEVDFDVSLDLPEILYKTVFLEDSFDVSLDLDGDFFSGQRQEAEITVTLQPRDILVISSCDYTATLNGENILENYFGDWIFVDPNSIEMIVSSVSGGNCEIKVDYVPRYL